MPTRQLDKAEMAQVVQLAIETLNERQRMAVLLSKFEDMSYQEIAETMEMSPQAIKSLLSRARPEATGGAGYRQQGERGALGRVYGGVARRPSGFKMGQSPRADARGAIEAELIT